MVLLLMLECLIEHGIEKDERALAVEREEVERFLWIEMMRFQFSTEIFIQG